MIEQVAAQDPAAERDLLLASVREARERTENLQRLSADLTRLLTPGQVAEVVVRHLTLAFDAFAGGVFELSEDGTEFRLLGIAGSDEGARQRYARIPADAPLPVRDAARTGEGVFLGSVEEWQARYGTAPRGLPKERTDAAWVALPLLVEDRLIGTLTLGLPGPRSFADDDRRFMRTFADLCAQALERARLYEAAAEAQRRAEFLSEASRLLTSSLDYHETLQSLARAAVPRLGDWCAVDMLVDPGASEWPPKVQRLAVMHQDPDRIEWAQELERRQPTDWSAPQGLPRVLRYGVTEFFPVITDEMLVASAQSEEELALLREIGFTAYLCLPLLVQGRVVGAITVCMTESGRHYSDADREMGEEMARRASLAVEHAELFRDAQAANAAKSEFLATMSHELRTPLNAIGGYTELLELGIHGPVTPEQLTALGRIRHGQRHLLSLINNVLNFARLEAGHVQYDLRTFDVVALLEHTVDLVAPLAQARRLALEVRPCAGPVLTLADPEKVEQVLLNLLSNAVKFTPEGGRIAVECVPAPSGIAIAVMDSGIGIPADRLGAVFEPFVQVHPGHTRPAEGTGLGLAISRDLARAMGGDLVVRSEPGAGSVFTLTLPAGPA